MKCPRCNHDNRAGAKFCEQCATPLSRNCSNCGTPLPDKARFCSECGHPADTAAAGSAIPSAATEASAAQPAGERRQAAVLFADISGYTALCASMEPSRCRRC